MAPEEHARQDRHERFRIWKKVLRFVPRRTAFHRYPFVGRFAEAARKRAYLWSFKSQHLRPAFYAGSILSVMPVMGIQLPLAFGLALILRGNFMILGGLQFITNPVTFLPIYFATYQFGAQIIDISGLGYNTAAEAFIDPNTVGILATTFESTSTTPFDQAVNILGENIRRIPALVIGGVIIGTLLGALLDFLWRVLAARIGPIHLLLQRGSHSTKSTGQPK